MEIEWQGPSFEVSDLTLELPDFLEGFFSYKRGKKIVIFIFPISLTKS